MVYCVVQTACFVLRTNGGLKVNPLMNVQSVEWSPLTYRYPV